MRNLLRTLLIHINMNKKVKRSSKKIYQYLQADIGNAWLMDLGRLYTAINAG